MNRENLDHIRGLLGNAVLLPIPARQKGCKLKGWPQLTLADTDSEPHHRLLVTHRNTGVLLGAASANLITVDCDGDDFLNAFLTANPHLWETSVTKGKRGGNVWLRMEGPYPETHRLELDGKPWGEFRSNGAQTVIAGLHPDGMEYELVNPVPPLLARYPDIRWPDGVQRAGKRRSAAKAHARGEEEGDSSASLDTASPGSLHVASGPLHAASARLHAAPLHNTASALSAIRASQAFESRHPVLSKIVDALISPLLPLEEGSRNNVLTGDICARLFGAVARQPAGIILHYLITADLLGGYPPAEAREKFTSAFTALQRGYTDGHIQPVTPQEREIFSALDERYQEAFGICRSLALRADPKYPPPKFFLSCGECAARLGLRDMMSAWRILQKLTRWKILLPPHRGTRHTGGKAAEFSWNLPMPPIQPTPACNLNASRY